MTMTVSRYEHYVVCKERGHEESGVILASNPPWDVCRYCGTHYRTEMTIVENNVPNEE